MAPAPSSWRCSRSSSARTDRHSFLPSSDRWRGGLVVFVMVGKSYCCLRAPDTAPIACQQPVDPARVWGTAGSCASRARLDRAPTADKRGRGQVGWGLRRSAAPPRPPLAVHEARCARRVATRVAVRGHDTGPSMLRCTPGGTKILPLVRTSPAPPSAMNPSGARCRRTRPFELHHFGSVEGVDRPLAIPLPRSGSGPAHRRRRTPGQSLPTACNARKRNARVRCVTGHDRDADHAWTPNQERLPHVPYHQWTGAARPPSTMLP